MTIEQAAALLGIAIPVIAGLDLLIRWAVNNHARAMRERIKQLERTAEDLQGRIRPDDWLSPRAAQIISDYKVELVQAQGRACAAEAKAANEAAEAAARVRHISVLREAAETNLARTQASLDDEQGRHAQTKTALAQRTEELHDAQAVIAAYEKGDTARKRIVEKTLRLEGKVWLQDVLHGAHRFIPLPERQVPVVSMLNLKGGVGKTTVTAYLAWAMARRGYRVLLVDLDLQGSLSSLFLSESQLRKRSDEGLLLRDYLAHAAREKHPHLDDYTAPVERLANKARLLATTDRLGYEELNLTFQWLFRIGRAAKQWSGRRDVRMLLRRGLHRAGLKKKYDLVLLDCPPLINLCCINALAASDYVVVPVTPSRKALERVPPLLLRVREITERVNPDLGVLGVVANRTQWKESMTPSELDLWKNLPQHCQDTYSMPVHRFDTFLPHRVTIRDAEADFPPTDDADILSTVERLSVEVEGRLPHYCRPTPPVAARGLFDSSEVSP